MTEEVIETDTAGDIVLGALAAEIARKNAVIVVSFFYVFLLKFPFPNR